MSREDRSALGLLPYDSALEYDAVVDTVPALDSGLPYADIFARAGRLIHLSSTSVLPENFSAPDASGLPVLDETCKPSPQSERGARRLALEEEIQSRFKGAVVIRCGGIYGPNRGIVSHFLEGDFRRAETKNRMVSRIHVYDLCQLIVACARAEEPPPLIHGVDERPSLNREVFTFLENELGVSVPGSWRTEDASGRAVKSLYAASLIAYRFPTYREGFLDSIEKLRASGKLK